MKPNQRVASRYLEARFFGLLSNHIYMKDLRRFEKELRSMFRGGQHKVIGSLDRKGDKVIYVEALGTKIAIRGFTKSGSGYAYKKLSVEINGRLVEKTDDLEVVRDIVRETLSDLGLRH